MKNKKLFYPIMSALTAAFIAVCAQICIPLPFGIPITLQTFAVALCGFLLGAKWGAVSIGVYLLIGLAGVPVFSAFSAGPSSFIGPTGGFLIGFIPFCILCGLCKICKTLKFRLLFIALGIISCHLFGIIHYSLVTETPLISAFILTSLPFILKDVLSALGAYFVGLRIKKSFP